MPLALPLPRPGPLPRVVPLRVVPARAAPAPPPARKLAPLAAVSARLGSGPDGRQLAAAREQVRRWLENHAGRPRPDFEDRWEDAEPGVRRLRFGGRRTEIEAVARSTGDASYLGAALTLRNSNGGVLGRTVVSVFGAPGLGRVRLTLHGPARPGERRPCVPWSPALIGRLARRPGLTDYGFPIRSEPWIVRHASDVERFIHLVTHPERTRPVFAAGLDRRETDPAGAALDPDELQQRTVGLSHVVILTGPMTLALTDRVGRRFSVFGNAFRTYRPGCRLSRDEWKHPMALGETMAAWAPGGSRRFVESLQREAFRTSVAMQAHPGHRLPFREVSRPR